MKVLLLPTIYGIIAFNSDNEPIAKVFSDKSIQQLSEIYIQKNNTASIEFGNFIDQLKNANYDEFEIDDPSVTQLIIPNNIKINHCEDLHRMKLIRQNLFNHFGSLNISMNFDIIQNRTRILSEFMIKYQIAEFSARNDQAVKKCVDTIADINKTINFLATRLREWYGLHFPELTDKLIADHVYFTQMVSKFGTRENFSKDRLVSELGMKEERAEIITDKALRSMGGTLDPKDCSALQLLANEVLNLVSMKEKMETYLAEVLEEIAPNLKFVLGVPVASQLISLAGSLERLAQFPSSTIQLLGAEKALFKALKFGAKTPKHGIIFQWHKIRSEKTYLRGKISRMVAGKISILAKVDYYKGESIGEKYTQIIDEKIELIRSTFPKPPEKKKGSYNDNQYKNKDQSDFSRKDKKRGKQYHQKTHFRQKEKGSDK